MTCMYLMWTVFTVAVYLLVFFTKEIPDSESSVQGCQNIVIEKNRDIKHHEYVYGVNTTHADVGNYSAL